MSTESLGPAVAFTAGRGLKRATAGGDSVPVSGTARTPAQRQVQLQRAQLSRNEQALGSLASRDTLTAPGRVFENLSDAESAFVTGADTARRGKFEQAFRRRAALLRGSDAAPGRRQTVLTSKRQSSLLGG